MALAQNFDEAPLAFQLIGGDLDQFYVLRYRGSEGLCQLFRFEIDVRCYDASIDYDKIIQTRGFLRIITRDGTRHFHGVVSRFELIDGSDEWSYYRIELVPDLWLLTQRYQSRIFQDQSTKAIIEDVLKSSKVTTNYQLDFTGVFEKRPYCVQYRETDYNFISRLLEEEGVYWYFEHTEDKHTFVATDKIEDYPPIEGEPALPFEPGSFMERSASHVVKFRRAYAVRPDAATMRDFNYQRPELKLEKTAQPEEPRGLEISDYPGEYATEAEGEKLAEIRRQELQTSHIVANGAASCIRLKPGARFKLEEHPNADENGEYLLTTVNHQGEQPAVRGSSEFAGGQGLLSHGVIQALASARQDDKSEHTRTLANAILEITSRLRTEDNRSGPLGTPALYLNGGVTSELAALAGAAAQHPLNAIGLVAALARDSAASVRADLGPHACTFECVPAATKFRPARATPRPTVRGVQTAVVVGPGDNQDIHTNEYGCVKVRFHWDRAGKNDDTASCWLRIGRPLSGGGYGLFMLPRVGHEVIVDFIEGDPDRPLIVGMVHNADHKPPYALPEYATRSAIKTHSSPGGGGTNEIRFEDKKDKEHMLIYAQRTLYTRSRGSHFHTMGNHQHVYIGNEQRTFIKKSRSTMIEEDDALHIMGEQHVLIDGDVHSKYGGSHFHAVSSEFGMNCGSFLVDAGSICLAAGGNFVLIDSAGVTIVGSVVKINSGGSATGPTQPKPAEPAEAKRSLSTKPGKDKFNQLDPSELPPIAPTEYEAHWVSIELKDEDDKPMKGELYEIETPSGKSIKGSLDINGFARVWVNEEGQCKIRFPGIDAEEWQEA